MERRISAFLEAQAAENGAARNTCLAYGRDLKDFAGWLAHRGGDFDTATQADVEAYLIACDAEGLSQATRARRLSSIRQLFRFGYEEGWRKDNPALRIQGPGRARRLPGTLDHAEVEALLTRARDHGRRRAGGPDQRHRRRLPRPPGGGARAQDRARWRAGRARALALF